jgi:TetR/AcrR family transcriptional regulator, fatty acid metabolism regulator protein
MGSGMNKKTRTKRQEQAIETRNRIYNAAIELMDLKGFENLTIVDISEKAGVSVGAFYHYFDSKNDILAEIFRKADDYFSNEVVLGGGGESIPEQIIEYFDHYAKFNMMSGVEMTQQLFNPKVKFFIMKGRPMLRMLDELIRQGQQRGEIKAELEPEEVVRFLFMMARGTVFDWSLHDGRYDLETAIRENMMTLVSTLTN